MAADENVQSFHEYLLVLLCVIVCSIAYPRLSIAIRRRRIRPRHNCKPPPALPNKARLLDLSLFSSRSKRAHNASFKVLFEKYGTTFQSQTLRSTKIFTIEPKNLQGVFATDCSSWGVEPVRLFAFGPFVGRGIMTTDGSSWHLSRELIKRSFSRVQVTNLSSYSVHVHRMLELLSSSKGVIDLRRLFEKLALDSSTELLFGTSAATLSDSPSIDAEKFLTAYNYGQACVGRRMQRSRWNFWTRDRRFRQSCATARAFVAKCVRQERERCSKDTSCASEKESSRLVLAQELLAGSNNITDITNQLLNVFLPAHDATAVALTNIFFHLSRHLTEYEKLRREVLKVLEQHPSSEWTFERLKSCRCLQNVMSETFRLNPSIGQMNRAALQDTVLPTGGGPDGTSPIFVPKGAFMTTSFYALHRLPQYFGADADEWRPDRWNDIKLEHWTYLPFSGGPRICIGQQLALTEVGYAVVKIVERFARIENADPVLEFVEDWKITTVSANGAKVRLFSE